MQVSVRGLRAVPFIAATFGFLLPFVTISCGGQTVVTLSGFQLVTGTRLRQPGMLGTSNEQSIPSEPLAVVALLCAIAGIAAAAVRGKPGRVGSLAAGVIGVAILLAARGKMDREANALGAALLELRLGAGYWLAMAGFGGGALLALLIEPRAVGSPPASRSPNSS